MFYKYLVLTIILGVFMAHGLIQCSNSIEERRGDYLAAGVAPGTAKEAGPEKKYNLDGTLQRETVLVYIDESLNSFSSALTRGGINYLAAHGTRHIIRLNGNTAQDRGPLSVDEERAWCEKKGIKFSYYNIEGQVEKIGQEISEEMAKGGVNVHCRNGAHRAPSMAAFYLRSQNVSRGEVIEIVGWQELVQDPGEYWRYIGPALM